MNTSGKFFSYDGYRQFLTALKQAGTCVRSRDWSEDKRVILLRHDVDLSVESALRLARIENELGVTATYLFRVSGNSYNVFASDNQHMIREIAACGFEVGLHFDPSVYGELAEDALIPLARVEADALASVAQQPIHTVSLHAPSIHGQWPQIAGFINAYDPRIFSDECYLSDSRMMFRGKDPFVFIQKAAERTIQILLHALHFGPTNRTYPKILADHLVSVIRTLDEEWRLCSSTYCDQIEGSLLDYLTRREGKA